MQNGVSRSYDDLTVTQIKDQAKRQAQAVSRNASAPSLISVARTQILTARTCESNADLKGAYSAYIKAVCLIQLFMDSTEFKAEKQPGKRGVLFKEYQDFQIVRYLHCYSFDSTGLYIPVERGA
jgi:ubiquitin carboxyl-terminal hydrolase 8